MAMQLEIYVYMHPSVLVYETRSNCGWDDVECRWKEGGRSARELEAGLGLGFVAFSFFFFSNFSTAARYCFTGHARIGSLRVRVTFIKCRCSALPTVRLRCLPRGRNERCHP
jgi:hypothetical protein